MTIKIDLKRIIKEDMGMTQENFSEKYDIPINTVQRVCNNSTMIRLSTLDKIAKAVGPDFNKIFIYKADSDNGSG